MPVAIAKPLRSEINSLALIALIFIIIHLATSAPYGFHRDELATLDDARHLEWGFVAYPPLTPVVGRVELALFGISTLGVRVAPILALALVVVISGLMARELGGSRRAQWLCAITVATCPIVTLETTVLQYVSFDYLWGVLLTYFLIRMLNSHAPGASAGGTTSPPELDSRWWLAIGAVIGLGMMTKYTMAFFVTGLAAGVLATRLRRQLLSPWVWAGVAISLLIFLPNLVWQIHHHFVSLEFLQHIHARDVRQGRTRGFLPEQLFVCVSAALSPLVFLGLAFYFGRRGRNFRAVGWMFLATFTLFLVAHARSYYLGPLYPALIAAGSVMWERWVHRSRHFLAIQSVTWFLLAATTVASLALFTPIAPIGSKLWKFTSNIQENFREEIGWNDLVATVGQIYQNLPASERAQTGIVAGNYGEAGAINLLGGKYGLPQSISGTNSAWYRSFPNNEPKRLIVLGIDDDFREEYFAGCQLAGHIGNGYGVINEESRDHPDIYLCDRLRVSWPEFWPHFRWFG